MWPITVLYQDTQDDDEWDISNAEEKWEVNAHFYDPGWHHLALLHWNYASDTWVEHGELPLNWTIMYG